MQNLIIDKPYRYVAPRPNRLLAAVFGSLLPRILRRRYGLHSVVFDGLDELRRSVNDGHGILLTPNHCRPPDPFVMGLLTNELRKPLFTMASWHLFMQNRFQSWLLPRLGVFSVHREGMDSTSIKEAIAILREARGPLLIFPEGIITRSNEHLERLNDGVAFMARMAARQREKEGSGRVVIHPVSIRYSFHGDLRKAIDPVLADIERRLTWQSRPDRPLMERLNEIGAALLALKEIEYLKAPQTGTLHERLMRLSNVILEPLEAEWKVAKKEEDVPSRVRALRMAIVPELIDNDNDDAERARRWRQLADLYLAQQLWLYPPDYVSSRPTVERILETVERFEEDLTDGARIHAPMRARVRIGAAITVSPEKVSSPDPVLAQIRHTLESTLADMGRDAVLFKDA